MAKKKTNSNQPRQATAQHATPAADTGQAEPASPRRRPVIFLVGFALLAMFLLSFIYRSQNQSLQVQRSAPRQEARSAEAGDSGQGGVPAAMESAMMAEIGKLMQQMRENPDDVGLLLQIADHFMTLQSWEQAETFLTRAMIAEPANLETLYKLGIVSFQMQRPEDAAGFFQQITELDPSHAHAQLNLGLLYKHFLNKPELATEYFRAVLELPDVPQEIREAAQKELNGEEQAPEGQAHGSESGS